MTLKRIISITFFAAWQSLLFSQPLYTISDSIGKEIKLSGTSTFHSWNMSSHSFKGDVQFAFSHNDINQIASLRSLTFSLDVTSLKSDESALDKNAYRALKSDQYKDIFFQLSSATISSSPDRKYNIMTDGKLSIAGVTRNIRIDVYCIMKNDTTITCSGSYQLNMTDYNVRPPTFMLGAMSTGNAVVLEFNFTLKKQPHI